MTSDTRVRRPSPRHPGIRRWQRRCSYRRSLRHEHRRPVVGDDRSRTSRALVRRGRGRSASGRGVSAPSFMRLAGKARAASTLRATASASRSSRRIPNEPNEETTTVTLTADGDQTLLVFEQRGMPLEKLSPATGPATRSTSRTWRIRRRPASASNGRQGALRYAHCRVPTQADSSTRPDSND